jgi:hypothetical protein
MISVIKQLKKEKQTMHLILIKKRLGSKDA